MRDEPSSRVAPAWRAPETWLAAASAALALLTVLWPTWIEDVLRLQPDAGDGEAEWALVLVLALISVAALGWGNLRRRAGTRAPQRVAE